MMGFCLGIRTGGRTGFILAAFCSGLLTVLYLFTSPGNPLLIFVVITVVGLGPGTLLGLISGGLIGLLVQRLGQQSSKRSALLSGLMTSITIAIIINLGLWRAFDFDPNLYWFLLGIPSTVYVLAGAWGGMRMRSLLVKSSSHATSPLADRISILDRVMMTAASVFVVVGLVLTKFFDNLPGFFDLESGSSIVSIWFILTNVTGVAVLLVYGGKFRTNMAKAKQGPV
jgi:hypothetical protein